MDLLTLAEAVRLACTDPTVALRLVESERPTIAQAYFAPTNLTHWQKYRRIPHRCRWVTYNVIVGEQLYSVASPMKSGLMVELSIVMTVAPDTGAVEFVITEGPAPSHHI